MVIEFERGINVEAPKCISLLGPEAEMHFGTGSSAIRHTPRILPYRLYKTISTLGHVTIGCITNFQRQTQTPTTRIGDSFSRTWVGFSAKNIPKCAAKRSHLTSATC